MYDFIQSCLTATIEAIALIILVGLPAHYIVMNHVREVQSWGTPHTTPAPHVEVEPEVKTEVQLAGLKRKIRANESIILEKQTCHIGV